MKFLLVALVISTFSFSVNAQEVAGTPVINSTPPFTSAPLVKPVNSLIPAKMTISISPILLFSPIFQGIFEYKIMDKLGVAGILGFGDITDPDTDITASIFEIGGQANYYVWGDFRKGLHVGTQLLYLYAWFDDDSISITGNGLSLGGYLGYKYSFDFGLALLIQLGYQGVVANAEADTGEEASGSDSGVLFNLNMGWTF
jgi:hypothetical protein